MNTFRKDVSLQDFEEDKHLDAMPEVPYDSVSESAVGRKIIKKSEKVTNLKNNRRKKKTVTRNNSSKSLKPAIHKSTNAKNKNRRV